MSKQNFKKRDWRIYYKAPGLPSIGKSGCVIKENEKVEYYNLSTTKKQKFQKFFNDNYKGITLKKIRELVSEIYRNIKKSMDKYSNRTDAQSLFNQICETVPKEFFGCNQQKKFFFKLAKNILTHTVHECVLRKNILGRYDGRKMPWLEKISDNRIWAYLYHPIIWLAGIVKYLVRRKYYFAKSSYPYEYQLIPFNQWNSYKDKVFNIMIKKQYIIPSDVSPAKVRGILTIVPKEILNKLRFRPILRLIKRRPKYLVKSYNKLIFDYARKLSKTHTGNFFNSWRNYCREMADCKFYGIKIDVSDAYGRIPMDELKQIITKMNIKASMKQDILEHISSQYVTFRNPNLPKTKTYQWKHGLLQGDQFSSSLCELYMSHLDAMNLSNFYQNYDFIHRTTDDYIFISTSESQIEKFLRIMKRTHVLNQNKISSNVKLHKSKLTNSLTYCGLNIDLVSKEITPRFNVKPEMSMHGKFKVWNAKVPVTDQNFIIRAMTYKYNNYYFQKHFLNLIYNTEETVLFNYFGAMVNLAFKFDVAVSAIYSYEQIEDYGQVLGEVVTQYAGKALQTIRKNKQLNSNLNINYATLVKVGYCAFRVVLRKKEVYNEIVKEIIRVSRPIQLKKPFDFKDYMKMPKSFMKIRMARVIKIITKVKAQQKLNIKKEG